MKDKKILFIIHRLYFKVIPKLGGIDRIVDFLKENNEITLIEHPFEKINHPSVFTVNNLTYNHQSFFNIPFVWIEEFIMNIIWVLKSHVKYDLAIASDPLNFFSCYVIKILNKTDKIQFHSTDYSLPRFDNHIFENIYQWLYKFALKKADIVTVVSQRMRDHTTIVLGYNQSNIFLLPNSPYFTEVPKIELKKKMTNQLVILSGIFENQVNMNNLLLFLKLVKKKYPDIILNIIGHVENNSINIINKKGFKNNLVFYGNLEYGKAIQKMAQSYIGITLYKKSNSYMYYGDSLKIREYAAAGLPIVCDNIYGTAEEVKKYDAGFVYHTTQEMVSAVDQLITNKKLYKTKSEHALSWAKEMDKGKLLNDLYKKIL